MNRGDQGKIFSKIGKKSLDSPLMKIFLWGYTKVRPFFYMLYCCHKIFLIPLQTLLVHYGML